MSRICFLKSHNAILKRQISEKKKWEQNMSSPENYKWLQHVKRWSIFLVCKQWDSIFPTRLSEKLISPRSRHYHWFMFLFLKRKWEHKEYLVLSRTAIRWYSLDSFQEVSPRICALIRFLIPPKHLSGINTHICVPGILLCFAVLFIPKKTAHNQLRNH